MLSHFISVNVVQECVLSATKCCIVFFFKEERHVWETGSLLTR